MTQRAFEFPPEVARLEGLHDLEPGIWTMVRTMLQSAGVRVIENDRVDWNTLISLEQAYQIAEESGFSRSVVSRGWHILSRAAKGHSSEDEEVQRRARANYSGLDGIEFVVDEETGERYLDLGSLAGKLEHFLFAPNIGSGTQACWRAIYSSVINPTREVDDRDH